MKLGARDRREHHCNQRVLIFHLDSDGVEQSTCATFDGAKDLESYIVGYSGVLATRGMARFIPHRAEVVSRGGRVLARWNRPADFVQGLQRGLQAVNA